MSYDFEKVRLIVYAILLSLPVLTVLTLNLTGAFRELILLAYAALSTVSTIKYFRAKRRINMFSKAKLKSLRGVEIYDFGGEYLVASTLLVTDIPYAISDFKIEDFARYSRSFTSIVSSVPGPFLVLLVKKNIEPSKYAKKLESKILHYRVISQADPSNPTVESKLLRLEKVLDRLSRGERPIRIQLAIVVYNTGGNLTRLIEDVSSRCKTLRTSIESLLNLKCNVESLEYLLSNLLDSHGKNTIEVLEGEISFLTPILPHKRPSLEPFGEGIYLGEDLDFKTPVFYDFEKYSLRHMVIVGPTGRGKTTFLKTLAKRVSDVYSEAQVWILDFKGEFSKLESSDFKLIDASKTVINFLSTYTTSPYLKAKQFIESLKLVSEFKPSEEYILYFEVSNLLSKKSRASFRDVLEYIRGGYKVENSLENSIKLSILSKIEPYLLLKGKREEPVETLLKSKTIIDLSKLPEEHRSLYLYWFLQELYNYMLQLPPKGEIRGVLILDEAWRLLRKRVGEELILKLVKEGRGYGISVILASQDFKDFPREILDNAGTIVVFGSNSKPYIEEVSNYMSLNFQEKEKIMWLNVGEALVRIHGDPRPLWVRVIPEEQ